MEGVGGNASSAMAPLAQWRIDFSRAFQYYLDRSTAHSAQRWLGTLAVSAIYALRVYYVQGFYVVSYGLGIYVLNLLIRFLSPKVDPELQVLDGASLPTKGSDEFKPFVQRLPEFKFWYSITKARSYVMSLGCSVCAHHETPNHAHDQIQRYIQSPLI